MKQFLAASSIAILGAFAGTANAYVLTQSTGSNGSVAVSAGSITLTGTDYGDNYDAANTPSYQSYYTQTFAADTLISFNWSYVSNDLFTSWGIPGQDEGGYYLSFTAQPATTSGAFNAGSAIALSDDSASSSGSVSNLLVHAGETFGWYVSSADGLNGAASITISNLVATTRGNDIPEPASLALALAGVGLLGLRKRSAR